MHSAMINRIAPMADGGLVTISNDKTIRLWNGDGTPRAVLRPAISAGDGGALYALAIAGQRLAVAGEPVPGGATITLVDAAKRRQIGTINLPSELGPATAAAFLADGTFLAVGFERGGLRLLDLAASKLAGEDRDYAGEISAIAADGHGHLAVSASDGVRLYTSGLETRNPGASPKPPGLYLARRTTLPGLAEPWGIAFSPNGRWLAVGSVARPAVWLLDGASLALRTSLSPPPGRGGSLAAVAWSADGRTLYAGGAYADGEGRPLLRAWPLDAPRRARDIALAGSDTVSDLAALPDGGLLWATAGPSFGRLDAGGRALFSRGRQQGDFRDGYEHGFAVSADGNRVAFALGPRGGKALVFDLRARKLAPLAAGADGLTAPRAEAADMSVSGWRNGTNPSANGQPLVLEPNEIARSVAVARDGSAVALGTDFYLRFYRGGRQDWRQVLPAPAWTVGLSGDGRYVVAALGDGTLRWYAADGGGEVMAVFVHADGRRWIAWTPDGYFDHSPADDDGPGGESLIGYHIDHGKERLADFVTVDQMYDRFYRRDLVLSRFAAAAGPPATAGEAPAEKALGQGLPPRLVLNEVCEAPDGPCHEPGDATIAVATPEVLLKLRLDDRGGGIGDVLMRRDGAVIEGEKKRTVAGASALEERRLPVAPGANRIELSALSASGEVETGAGERPAVTVRYTPPAAASPAAAATAAAGSGAVQPAASDIVLYVLAVGVSKYEIPDFRLEAAANDARAIAETMKESAGQIYQKAEATVLVDSQATTAGIEQAFHAIAAKARPQDMVLIFLAGHGEALDGRYYFAPYELGIQHRERLTRLLSAVEWNKLVGDIFRDEGVGQDRLVEWIRGIAAARVVVMLDTCYAGGLAVNDATERAARNDTFTNTLGHSAGRIVLAGANGEALDSADAAVAADQRHGLFTYVVLKGLDGAADYQKRGKVRVTDLALYVKDTVPREAAERRDVQEPAYYFAGNDFFDLRALPKPVAH